MSVITVRLSTLSLLIASTVPLAHAQVQKVSPPKAQAWIDIATFSGVGGGAINALAGAAAGSESGGFMGAIKGLMAGARGQVPFGMTMIGGDGPYMDVTLMVRGQSLTEAMQAVPSTTGVAPTIRLLAPAEVKPGPVTPDNDDEVVQPAKPERPEGKVVLYWGCGEQVRAGQPKVLDMKTSNANDLAAFLNARRDTRRGAHSTPGRPIWPNAEDGRRLAEGASIAGEHAFTGAGVPDGFRFTVPPGFDLMRPFNVTQSAGDPAGPTQLQWQALPNARGYFFSAFGARGDKEMVIWSSSEQPDLGMGLIDYQPNASIDRWLREKVVLPASATRCAIPAGVFANGAGLLRAIAYGNEFHVAHPPRPTDPKQAWAPDWSAQVRVKSVSNLMLGADASAAGRPPARGAADDGNQPAPSASGEQGGDSGLPGALGNAIKGIFGR